MILTLAVVAAFGCTPSRNAEVDSLRAQLARCQQRYGREVIARERNARADSVYMKVRPARYMPQATNKPHKTIRPAGATGPMVAVGRTQFENAAPHAEPGTTRTGTAGVTGASGAVSLSGERGGGRLHDYSYGVKQGGGVRSVGLGGSERSERAAPHCVLIFTQRHPGWTTLGALVLGGIIGYALHDDDRGARIYVGSVEAADVDECAPHHPRGKHKGWQ